jgi:hypothetical protein
MLESLLQLLLRHPRPYRINPLAASSAFGNNQSGVNLVAGEEI